MNNIVNANITIKEARNLMRPKLKKGTTCLCCGLHTQVYVRPITSAMVYGLILLYRECKDKVYPEYNYVHLEDFFKPLAIPSSIRGDAPKLRFWGLIEPMEGQKEDGNPSTGYYRITKHGIDFINGHCLIFKAVRIYNNTFYGFEGPEIDVYGAIKNKFNYNDLMGGKT